MKRILLGILVALGLAASASAVENSVTFMPLTLSTQFLNRVTFIIAMEAPVIEIEAQTGSYTAACHTLRANLAAAVARNPSDFSGRVFATHLVANVNVTTAGALTGTLAAGTLDTPATDAALLAAVASLWSTVAGCITNP